MRQGAVYTARYNTSQARNIGEYNKQRSHCSYIIYLLNNKYGLARVVANGWTSAAFPLFRGTRQGCPISPLLYALAVEPLAMALRSHPGVRRLSSGDLMKKIGLYADDIVLYLTDSGPSLTLALQIIKQFGASSL